jgi:hypothetical protein
MLLCLLYLKRAERKAEVRQLLCKDDWNHFGDHVPFDVFNIGALDSVAVHEHVALARVAVHIDEHGDVVLLPEDSDHLLGVVDGWMHQT